MDTALAPPFSSATAAENPTKNLVAAAVEFYICNKENCCWIDILVWGLASPCVRGYGSATRDFFRSRSIF
jgi:hypothetical protein